MKRFLLTIGSLATTFVLGMVVDVTQADAYYPMYDEYPYYGNQYYGGQYYGNQYYGTPYYGGYGTPYMGAPYYCHYYGSNGACYNYSYRNNTPYYPQYSYHYSNRSYHPYDVRTRVRYDRYDDRYTCGTSSRCYPYYR